MNWNDFFKSIENKEYFIKLKQFLDNEYQNEIIYPKKENLFKAFELTPVDQIKVVVFGQDPYHEPEQAVGLAFSVPDYVKTPPSLINIYREIEDEYNTLMSSHDGDLTYLAEQGVLLLNTILSVREHKPMSHNNKEYKQLTLDIIRFLNALDQPIVFLLWGNNAQKYERYLDNNKHLVLKATHPSPLGANQGGWFGCGHFIKTNEFLNKNHVSLINWIK